MKSTDTTGVIASAAANASAAASAAATAAASAANNAQIAAKAAADSATAIAIVATDTSWMKGSLKRLEETLDSVSRAFVTSAQHNEVLKQLDNHEDRLNSLETEKTRVMVLLSVSGFLLSAMIGLIIYHILGG